MNKIHNETYCYLTDDSLALLRILESSLDEELLLSLLLPEPEFDEERDAERCTCFGLDLLGDLGSGWLDGERDSSRRSWGISSACTRCTPLLWIVRWQLAYLGHHLLGSGRRARG